MSPVVNRKNISQACIQCIRFLLTRSQTFKNITKSSARATAISSKSWKIPPPKIRFPKLRKKGLKVSETVHLGCNLIQEDQTTTLNSNLNKYLKIHRQKSLYQWNLKIRIQKKLMILVNPKTKLHWSLMI